MHIFSAVISELVIKKVVDGTITLGQTSRGGVTLLIPITSKETS